MEIKYRKSKNELQYIWISEPGACDKCKSLDGKIYDSAEDIPPKPHPNCKCHVKPIEKKKNITDPIEKYRANSRKENQTKIELEKLEGDIKCLLDETNAAEEVINNQLEQINKIVEDENFKNLSDSDKNAIEKYKFDIRIEKNEISQIKEKANSIISALKELKNFSINTINNIADKKDALANKLKQLDTKLYRIVDEIAYRTNIISILRRIVFAEVINPRNSFIKEPDATALWNIAATKDFQNNNYINENGKVIDTINDIQNPQMQEHISKKVKQQLGSTNKKGIWFHAKSSLAKAYSNSKDFKAYIKNIKPQLVKNKECPNGSIEFKAKNDANLYHAIHYADILEIKLDKQENLHAKIFDTYDFNKDKYFSLVGQARILQEHHDIETYYTITDIIIPKDIWMNY